MSGIDVIAAEAMLTGEGRRRTDVQNAIEDLIIELDRGAAGTRLYLHEHQIEQLRNQLDNLAQQHADEPGLKGRPRRLPHRGALVVYLHPTELAELATIAADAGIDRNRLVRRWLRQRLATLRKGHVG